MLLTVFINTDVPAPSTTEAPWDAGVSDPLLVDSLDASDDTNTTDMTTSTTEAHLDVIVSDPY